MSIYPECVVIIKPNYKASVSLYQAANEDPCSDLAETVEIFTHFFSRTPSEVGFASVANKSDMMSGSFCSIQLKLRQRKDRLRTSNHRLLVMKVFFLKKNGN